MVGLQLALLTHCKKFPGFSPVGTFLCVIYVFPVLLVGFLQELQLPPTVQTHLCDSKLLVCRMSGRKRAVRKDGLLDEIRKVLYITFYSSNYVNIYVGFRCFFSRCGLAVFSLSPAAFPNRVLSDDCIHPHMKLEGHTEK